MKIALTIISLIIVGCRDSNERLPPANVEALNLYPELNPDNLIIGFGETQENAAGECIKTSSHNFILINESAWKVMNYDRRKALIMHELGHCVFNLEHNNEVDLNGNPVSIMWRFSWDNEQIQHFKTFEKYYIQTLY